MDVTLHVNEMKKDNKHVLYFLPIVVLGISSICFTMVISENLILATEEIFVQKFMLPGEKNIEIYQLQPKIVIVTMCIVFKGEQNSWEKHNTSIL